MNLACASNVRYTGLTQNKKGRFSVTTCLPLALIPFLYRTIVYSLQDTVNYQP